MVRFYLFLFFNFFMSTAASYRSRRNNIKNDLALIKETIESHKTELQKLIDKKENFEQPADAIAASDCLAKFLTVEKSLVKYIAYRITLVQKLHG